MHVLRHRDARCSYMTCVRTNTGWKYCLIGVLGSMGLAILKASSAALCK